METYSAGFFCYYCWQLVYISNLLLLFRLYEFMVFHLSSSCSTFFLSLKTHPKIFIFYDYISKSLKYHQITTLQSQASHFEDSAKNKQNIKAKHF